MQRTSSQTRFQAARQSPGSLSSYTRERCGRDPIRSSDWISSSRRGARELLTPPHPPFFFLCILPSFALYVCLYTLPLIYFLHKLFYISHSFPFLVLFPPAAACQSHSAVSPPPTFSPPSPSLHPHLDSHLLFKKPLAVLFGRLSFALRAQVFLLRS